MIFQKLNVFSFGKLKSGINLKFSHGLNVLYAQNEGGKSTLSELISSLLYGFSKRSAGVHPYDPWTSGVGKIGGRLFYELDDGNEFKLERYLLKRGEKISLVNLKNDREIDLKGLTPGEKYLGLKRGVFLTVGKIQLNDLQKAFSGINQRRYKITRQDLLGHFFLETESKSEIRNPIEVCSDWEVEAAKLYHRDKRRNKVDQVIENRLIETEKILTEAKIRDELILKMNEEVEGIDKRILQLKTFRRNTIRDIEKNQIVLKWISEIRRKSALEKSIFKNSNQGLINESIEWQVRQKEEKLLNFESDASFAYTQVKKRVVNDKNIFFYLRKELNLFLSQFSVLRIYEKEILLKKSLLKQEYTRIKSLREGSFKRLIYFEKEIFLKLKEFSEILYYIKKKNIKFNKNLFFLSSFLSKRERNFNIRILIIFTFILFALGSFLSTGFLWYFSFFIFTVIFSFLSFYSKSSQKKVYRSFYKERIVLEKLKKIKVISLKLELEQERFFLKVGTVPRFNLYELVKIRRKFIEIRSRIYRMKLLLKKMRRKNREVEKKIEKKFKVNCRKDLFLFKEKFEYVFTFKSSVRRKVRDLTVDSKKKWILGKLEREELSYFLSSKKVKDLSEIHQSFFRYLKVKSLKNELKNIKKNLRSMPNFIRKEKSFYKVHFEFKKKRFKINELDEKIEKLNESRNILIQKIRKLKKNKSQVEIKLSLKDLYQERFDLISRHGTIILAKSLLEMVMIKFKKETQPRLFKRASSYLKKITNDAYEWIGSNIFDSKLDRDPELMVRSLSGEKEQLSQSFSRSTQDQFYLCLKLALAQEISEDGENVPLIMDDPLVNLDQDRLFATLLMLADLAKKRQIIFFTCHKEQRDILKKITECKFINLT